MSERPPKDDRLPMLRMARLHSNRRLAGGFRFGLRSTAAGSVLDRSSLGGLARRRTPRRSRSGLPLGGSMVLAALDHPDRLADDDGRRHCPGARVADGANEQRAPQERGFELSRALSPFGDFAPARACLAKAVAESNRGAARPFGRSGLFRRVHAARACASGKAPIVEASP